MQHSFSDSHVRIINTSCSKWTNHTYMSSCQLHAVSETASRGQNRSNGQAMIVQFKSVHWLHDGFICGIPYWWLRQPTSHSDVIFKQLMSVPSLELYSATIQAIIMCGTYELLHSRVTNTFFGHCMDHFQAFVPIIRFSTRLLRLLPFMVDPTSCNWDLASIVFRYCSVAILVSWNQPNSRISIEVGIMPISIGT